MPFRLWGHQTRNEPRRNRGEIPDYLVSGILSLYRAMENGEFELVTDHVEKLTGTPPEHPESYFKRILNK